MNDWDRGNLEFLLAASQETLKDWYAKVDEADRLYAFNLLQQYGNELKIKAILYKDEVADLSEASSILKRF